MKKIIVATAFLSVFLFNCGGSSVQAPDPKRVGCENTCGPIAKKAVDECKKKKKAEDVCKAAGTAAESKCIDECMAK